ncbi:DUF1833 family protein [Brenneria sp. 4F2]|nr:DUF1833 family protein [Brenneria bubanii]
MTVLDRIYASGGSEVIIPTLDIEIGSEHYYLTHGYDDILVTLEDGSSVTFIACAISVALPARNADGTQDLKFAISNVDGIVSTRIRKAIEDNAESYVTYREYIDTYLTEPSKRPWTMRVKGGYWKNIEVQITAGYMNVLDTAWPRYRYTLPNFPGLRYLS